MAANKNIKKVLVAPLDWGLGHATRCIPVIRGLLAAGCEVILAAEGAQAVLLQTEFPALTCLPLEGYRVRYSKDPARLSLVLLWQLPRLMRVIRQEHQWLNKMIDEQAIDLVISDNRYGLYSKRLTCIFITHQLLIKAPFGWLEKLLQRINYKYINRFTACWIPDTPGRDNLAGELSHPEKMPSVPVHYLGLLPRMHFRKVEKMYRYCFLLSGPEPQRSLLEEKILHQVGALPGNILLVRGKPGSTETLASIPNVEIKNHLPQQALEEAILQSEYIICRSGYTTVMELFSLRSKMLLIPTPGQTEQEYLANRMASQQLCCTVKQGDLDLERDLAALAAFGLHAVPIPVFAEENIRQLLNL